MLDYRPVVLLGPLLLDRVAPKVNMGETLTPPEIIELIYILDIIGLHV